MINLEVSHYRCKKCGVLQGPLTAANKTLCSCQDLRHQLWRSSLCVHTQQWLRSGGAEQDPRLSAVAVRRSIKKKLDAIEALFFQYAIAPQALRGFGSSALNGVLLDFFRNVQIAPAVIVRAEVALQVRAQLAQRLAFFRHCVGQ